MTLKTKKIAPAQNAYEYQLTIKKLLDNALIVNPSNTISYKDILTYTYRDFKKRVAQYANLLKKLELNGGVTIGIMDYDSHRFLEGYFAIPMTGNVLHTVNWRLSPNQIAYTINHAEDEVLFVHKDFLPVLNSIKNEIKTVKKFILINEDGIDNFITDLDFIGEYEELLALEKKEYDFPDFDEDSVATIFYTSGTTGNPKGVYFTHKQIVIQCLIFTMNQAVFNSAMKISIEDVYSPLTPMFHIQAWGVPYIATMLGIKQVYAGKFDPESFLDLFIKKKPSFSHGVPTILNMILHHPKSKEIDFSNWKIIVGGSGIPDELVKEALKRGIDIITGYGMSETGPLLTLSYLNKEQIKQDIDTQINLRTRTGRPALFIDLRVVDENNNDVPKDDKTLGEVVARGPSFTTGYYKDVEQGEILWKNGYLHTGDLATINEDNHIMVKDRIKDVIKSGGEWISSLFLESLIAKYEGVLEVAVVAIPDSKWIERPHALVVPKPGYILNEESIKAHLQQFVNSNLINKWAIPQDIDIVKEIQKTSVGKFDKKLIRRELENRNL